MDLSIPDDILKQAGLTEDEALVELACHLFDTDRLDFPTAARMAHLDRMGFERELRSRNLPVIHYTEEHYEQDRATIAHLDRIRRGEEEGRK